VEFNTGVQLLLPLLEKNFVDCMFRDINLRTLAVVGGPVDEDE